MALDWVPLFQYMTGIPTPSNSRTDQDLMDPQNWSLTSQSLGTVEDENTRYKIERIIGYWTVGFQAVADQGEGPPTTGHVTVRCWPGFQDQNAQAPLVPGALGPGTGAPLPEAQRAGNEKWWWERIVPFGDIARADIVRDRWNRLTSSTHPWHVFADFKPKMWMGDSLTPTISIQNDTDVEVFFRHRWRAVIRH